MALRSQPNPQPVREELFRLCLNNQRACRACMDNLANQFTPGYRASDVLYATSHLGSKRFPLRMNQGQLQETRDPYNLAIDGSGFFLLNDGSLTRDGSWALRQGRLCIAPDHNLYLMSQPGQPLTIPDNYTDIQIQGDGFLTGTELNGDGKPQQLGSIRLARVADPRWLERVQNRLLLTPESGPILSLDQPGQNGAGVLAQGYIEQANVNPLEQLETALALRRYAGLLGDPMLGLPDSSPPQRPKSRPTSTI